MQHADDDLSAAERFLYDQSARGQMTNYSEAQPVAVSGGASWGPERTVRAEKLRALLTEGVQGLHVHWRGVQIRGAKITGVLDLTTAILRYLMELTDCFVESPMTLVDMESRRIVLTGSHIAGLDATGAQIRGGLYLDRGFTSLGPVSLVRTTVVGELACDGGHFLNKPRSIVADRATVTGTVRLGVTKVADAVQTFRAVGSVYLVAARVGGDLDCDGGQFGTASDSASTSLDGAGAQVDGTAYLGVTEVAGQAHAFSAAGQVRLVDAKVGGDLNCDGGQFGTASDSALASTSLSADKIGVTQQGAGVTVRLGSRAPAIAGQRARDCGGC